MKGHQQALQPTCPTTPSISRSTSLPTQPCRSRPLPPCSECVRAGVTMLSIGHRPALRQFHSEIVEFDGNGHYNTHTLRDSDRDGLAEAEAAAAAKEQQEQQQQAQQQ